VYRTDRPAPYREDDALGCTNPYGWTKLMIEQILRDVAAADPGWAVGLLRYFNPVGAHPSGLIGEDPQGIPNNLMPFVAKVATGELPRVRVFGNDYDTPDGTGVRDYIHVMDLARGHLLALDYLADRTGTHTFNLGRGSGYSVLDVIAAYGRACGHDIPYEIAPRRAGDPATVYADVTRAREALGFETEFDIDAMCADSWRYSQEFLAEEKETGL
jgi:UDP-glucose 4-epimerase